MAQMQVEHKTEQGTVLFVKIPEHHTESVIERRPNGIRFAYFSEKWEWLWLENGDWQLIGLTTEVTEEQAKMMLSKQVMYENDKQVMAYRDFSDDYNLFNEALPSFKSLMKHKKLYEVNPYPKPTCECLCEFDREGCPDECYRYINANNCVAKRVVLFKPNEK